MYVSFDTRPDSLQGSEPVAILPADVDEQRIRVAPRGRGRARAPGSEPGFLRLAERHRSAPWGADRLRRDRERARDLAAGPRPRLALAHGAGAPDLRADAGPGGPRDPEETGGARCPAAGGEPRARRRVLGIGDRSRPAQAGLRRRPAYRI